MQLTTKPPQASHAARPAPRSPPAPGASDAAASRRDARRARRPRRTRRSTPARAASPSRPRSRPRSAARTAAPSRPGSRRVRTVRPQPIRPVSRGGAVLRAACGPCPKSNRRPDRPRGRRSGRGESNPHFWLGKPTSWPLDNARGGARGYRSREATLVSACAPRVYWPVTVAAALLVGLLAYGAHDHRHGHDARRRDGRAASASTPPADEPLPRARRRRHRLARRLQGQGRARQRLGVVVRARAATSCR